MIDGRRDRSELLAEGLAAALGRLEGDGVVVAAHTGEPWWSSQRAATAPGRAPVQAAAVAVIALGEVDAAPVTQALRCQGVAVVDPGPAALQLVLVGDYLDPGLAEINARALAGSRPWLLAQPARAAIRWGPVFTPDRGPCWECLAQRRRFQRQAECDLRERFGARSSPLPVDGPPGMRGLGAAAVVSVAARWLAGRAPASSR